MAVGDSIQIFMEAGDGEEDAGGVYYALIRAIVRHCGNDGKDAPVLMVQWYDAVARSAEDDVRNTVASHDSIPW